MISEWLDQIVSLFYYIRKLSSHSIIAIAFLDFLGLKYCPGGAFENLLCRPSSILDALSQCFQFLFRLQILEERLKEHFLLMQQEQRRRKKNSRKTLGTLLSQKAIWFLGGWRSFTDRSFHETLGVFRLELDRTASALASMDATEKRMESPEAILSSFSLALEAFLERLGLREQDSKRATETQFQLLLDLFSCYRDGKSMDRDGASLGASFDGSLVDTPPPFTYFF